MLALRSNAQPSSSGWLKRRTATIADLFAGTGGMGLATLLSPRLRTRSRIIYVAEFDPTYAAMIQRNYAYAVKNIVASEQMPRKIAPIDLSERGAIESLKFQSRRHGGLTLLLAGPPCQGFSTSNSMSRVPSNPQNLLAFRAVEAVKAARPLIAIIENVPGIGAIKSAKKVTVSTRDHIERMLFDAGYYVESHLLNAADYGVPQHRIRSFTIAIASTIMDAFHGRRLVPDPIYGPDGRFPYRTVGDAFSDLPAVDNGTVDLVTNYATVASNRLQRELRRHSRLLTDHVTSLHSGYVIERFRRVPPGGNWIAIRDTLDNYSQPENTHHNIYHRLDPDSPARTIGNFRKSMTVHPWEHRGLSIREGARLQSLPDWMRFLPDNAPLYRGRPLGLGAAQQQVGNAVCFQLTQTLVTHLMKDA